MAESLAAQLVEASKRAVAARGGEWDELDARATIAAALWELAGLADRKHPEVRLENPQRAAIRDLASSIDES